MSEMIDLLEIDSATASHLKERLNIFVNTYLQDCVSKLDLRPYPHAFRLLESTCVDIVVGAHLRLIDTENARSSACKGVDFGKKYFLEKWFEAALGKKVPKELRKSPKNKELEWSNIFRNALLLSFLVDDHDAVKQLSSWPEAWMRLDLSDDDPLWGVILVSIAAAFRDLPMKGIEEAEEAALKGQGKGPKLCMQAWGAAHSGDSALFEQHLINAIKHFEKTAIEPHMPADVIAVYPSLVLAAARCKGMELPDLEPRLLARLLTPESVGFGK